MFPKPGIVRLKGKDMEALRIACYMRDAGRCVKCRIPVNLKEGQGYPVMHMAHVRTKRNNGDYLGNVKTLCGRCHGLEHNGGKPVPAKERTA